jgi:hypothetical protein
MNRTCGECRECCKTFPVAALAKPAGQWCRHTCANGCAIYTQPERPKECGDYRCLWLRGALGENDRPDKIKCIIDLSVGPDKNHLPVIRENCQNASSNNRVRAFISHNLDNGIPVVIVNSSEQLQLVTPPMSKGHVDANGRIGIDYADPDLAHLAAEAACDLYDRFLTPREKA